MAINMMQAQQQGKIFNGANFMDQVIHLREAIGEAPQILESGKQRILGAAMALLGQAQGELDQQRKQIEALRQKVAQLEDAATTDLLTGLKNRRGFEQAFEGELDRVRRGKSIGGVLLLIDMDNFKAINDTFGHAAGDACLRLVGQLLGHEVRAMDTAARLGGDEFVILMTDTTAEVLLSRIQGLIWKLNNLSLVWDGTEIRIGASVGMKPYDKSHTAEEIFSGADKDMYTNKRKSKEMAATRA